MNRYDKEIRIIEDFQNLKHHEVLLLPFNCKNIRIYNAVHNRKKWKSWVDTSSKKDLPPDFYNERLKLMMDVMRIDDHADIDEKGRIINRHNERESQIINELINVNEIFKEVAEKGNLLIVPDSGLRENHDHNYDFYISNFRRVVEKHITKISMYKQNHPGFKTIFFIFDESSPYVECFDSKRPTYVGERFYASSHMWWLDKNMLQIVQNSEIDYLVWMCPYKHFDAEEKIEFPKIIIYDLNKFDYNKCINYKNGDMQSLEL